MSQSRLDANLLKEPRSQVMIIDDHELVRTGLRYLIGKQTNLEVCGEAVNAAQARRLVLEVRPDVVIADLRLPDENGLELIKWIIETRPATKVIVSTMHDEREYGERVLRLGAMGFVNKRSVDGSILLAISRVLEGKYFFSEAFTDQIMRQVNHAEVRHVGSPTSVLSNRELEILTMLGQGQTSEMIARNLFLSRNTIGTYRERLKVKLNFKNSTELTHFAIRWLEDSACPASGKGQEPESRASTSSVARQEAGAGLNSSVQTTP